MNYAALKVTELKTELRARGLPVSGPKAELVERLTLYMAQQESLTSTTAPTTSTVVTEEKKKVEEAEDDLDDLLLDNDLSTEEIKNVAAVTSNDVKPNIDPVQISSMTETDKKQARADRFKTGTESNNSNSNSNNISTADDLAAKKSRAERFGNVESAAAKDLEAEKKKSRADRFGTGGNSGTSGTTETSKTAAKTEENNSVDLEAKKRRAERFGIVESDVSPKKSAKITSYEKDPVDAEKLKSRAERFGVVSLEDKSKQALRAARFGV